MALYRLSVKLVKEHVSSKVAYIEREGKYSRGTKAEDLRESWSSDMPTWAVNSADFWNDIEKEEKPGQVQARGIELALPVELSKEEQRAIVEEFSDTVLKNHARTIAIHDSKDGKNPHVHIYFLERKIDDRKEPERGKYCRQRVGYSKDRSINGAGRKQWLKNVRKAWENIQNKALENAGFLFEQVSCESLEAQGITREAQIHVGYQDVNRYRKTGEKGARMRRNEAILSRNRNYMSELSAAKAEVKRLEKAVKEERQAKEEAAQKAAEAKRKAEEAQRIEAARLWMEAAKKDERRRADDEAKAKVEAAKKAEEARKAEAERRRLEAEAARRAADDEARKEKEAVEAAAMAKEQLEKQPEQTAPEGWISDEIMHQIAGTWFNAKHFDHDAAAMKAVISRILPGKIDLSQIDEAQQERLCEAAMAVLGQIRRGARIKTEEAGKSVFCEILEAARVPEKKPERQPERTPERSPEQRQSKLEITRSKKKDQNRGYER